MPQAALPRAAKDLPRGYCGIGQLGKWAGLGVARPRRPRTAEPNNSWLMQPDGEDRRRYACCSSWRQELAGLALFFEQDKPITVSPHDVARVLLLIGKSGDCGPRYAPSTLMSSIIPRRAHTWATVKTF